MRTWIQKITITVCLLFNLGNLDVVVAQKNSVTTKTTTVEGRITFQGAIPSDKQSVVTRDAEYCGKSITEALVLRDSASHGIEEVVVSIEGIAKTYPKPRQQPVQLANQNCRFAPRVQATYRGSRLEITSVDPVLHNTHIHQNRKTFLNVAVPPNRPIIKRLARPGRLDVRCDAHKFMEASIHVFDHPYFTVTEKGGLFKISDVPPGTYQLNVWHQYLGLHTQTIDVSETDRKTIDVELKK